MTTFHSQFTCQTKRTNDSSDWQHPSVVSPTMSSKTIGHQSIYGIADASHQAWKYFDEHEPFEELDLYLPSRFRRCILQKVGETLRSHADCRDAFQSIQSVLPKHNHKIRRIHRRRIKEQLWDGGDHLLSGYVDILIDQLTSCDDRHGAYPATYFEMQVQSTIAASCRSLRTTAQPAGRQIPVRRRQ